MRQREVRLAASLSSLPNAILLGVAGVMMAIWAYGNVHPAALTADRGIMVESPNLWLPEGSLTSFLANMTCLAGITGLMAMVNRLYNIVRNYSPTFIGLFLLMTASTPGSTVTFTGGTLLALTVMAAETMLVSAYSDPRLTRRIFLAFYILALGALTQYAFIAYLIIFVTGLVQIRAFGGRSLTAALLAVISAPVAVVMLSGGADFRFHRPEIVNIFAGEDLQSILRSWVPVAFTLVAGSVLGSLNLLKIFSFNAHSRAVNGLTSTVAFITAAMSVIDFTNMPVYIVLLNALTALQAGHFAALYARRRGYLVYMILPVVYAGFFIWNMI